MGMYIYKMTKFRFRVCYIEMRERMKICNGVPSTIQSCLNINLSYFKVLII